MLGREHAMSCPETPALSRKYLAGNAADGEEKAAMCVYFSGSTECISVTESEGTDSSAATSQDLPDYRELQEVIEEMGRQELRDLPFPFLLVDPSKPLCPVVACSDGFADLTGYDAGETLGQKAAYDLRGKQAAKFLECSSRSELYAGAFGRQSAAEWALGADDFPAEDGELGEGELFTTQIHRTRSGEYFSCVTFLKQVYIEDEMFVLALQARPQGGNDDSLQACVAQLRSNMEAALQILPALFWFSAPLMRLSNGWAPKVKPLAAAEDAGRKASECVYFSSEDSTSTATSEEDFDHLREAM